MNICMFSNTYLPHVGGVARSVSTFATDLRDLGHRVLVVAPRFPEDHRTPDEEHVLRVPAIQNFNGSDFSVRIPLPFTISEEIDRFEPEIIHSHHPFLLGDTALRIARQRRLPLVFTHHTLYEQYTHYVPFDSKPMKRFVVRLCTEYANMCTRVVAPSRSVAEILGQRGVRRPIREIPTGVDVDFFSDGDGAGFRARHGIPGEAFVLGHLGRLAPEKNLRYLTRAMAAYLERSSKGLFLVVGSGPSEPEMKGIFRESGIEHKLLLAGKKTGEELRDAYKAMDGFVFASKSETQGLVLMEAMAAGVPVIALDASGSREVVEDRVNGRLLPGDEDYQAFARAVEEYARDGSKAASWQQGALRTARRFSRQACAQALSELYGSLRLPVEEDKRDPGEDLVSWDALQRALKAEWDLITKKTTAAFSAVREGRDLSS
jgi:glycosyltransferase involved in cell wall biosynthesis